MKHLMRTTLAAAFFIVGCDSDEPSVQFKDILGSEKLHIWIQAAGRTWDSGTYKATLNSCFEGDGSQGRCGLRVVDYSEYWPDSVSVGTGSEDAADHGKVTECDSPSQGGMKWGNIYEMVCNIELTTATPGEKFSIDVNSEGSARIVMPIWPNTAKDYLSISLPVTDQNVYLSKVSDAEPLTLMWDPDTEDSSTISWTISNLDQNPGCTNLDYSDMHSDGLPDSGEFEVKPSTHTFPTVVSTLPAKGCAALLTVTRVLGGTPIPTVAGTVEARVSSERAIVIFE